MKNVEKEIDGIKYVIGTYSFGVDIEIGDRSIAMTFDEKKRTLIPTTYAGLSKLLSLVNALKSWTFKGMDNGELIKGDGVKILDINEENVKKLPAIHGNILAEISAKINGISEEERKNLL